VPEVLKQAGVDNLNGKIIVDISNPLDFSKGMPPSLIPEWSNTNSLGELVQKSASGSKVVKTLNMVNCEVMVNASLAGGDVSMMLCGEDAEAKLQVGQILRQFGWTDIMDLGGIQAARGMEMLLPVWLSLWQTIGKPHFGFKIVR
jgi:predicted dinucleotide-binding enzyme